MNGTIIADMAKQTAHEVGIAESLDLSFPVGRERCGLADHRIAPGLHVMACHPVQPAGEFRIREIQMFGNAQEMQIGSVVDDGSGYGRCRWRRPDCA
jgi:hypothetical protein